MPLIRTLYTKHTQKNGAVLKVIKNVISYHTRAQHTLSLFLKR
jgi:hypothetical protein